jgi:hypothetical protein
VTELLATPPTVTTTGPVVAPDGTLVAIAVGPQLVGVATAPLNMRVLAPGEFPNPEPVILTEVPAIPDAGERELIVGVVREKLTVVPCVADTKTPFFVTGEYPVSPGGEA